MFETTLGAALAALRKRAGLSMAEVIERLSMPRSTAYWHESASGRPSPEHLQALLDLYQATDDERLEAWRLRSLPLPVQDASVPQDLRSRCDAGQVSACAELTSGVGRGR